ncbi:ATP-binding protein [Rhodocaloribacter sp.]
MTGKADPGAYGPLIQAKLKSDRRTPLMTHFRNLSINRKLTLIIALVGGTALLAACIGFMAYDLITYRATLARELSIQARIIGANSSAALLFGDADAAGDNLAALQAEPRIMAAYLYDADGRPVARYLRPDVSGAEAPPIPAGEVHRYHPGDIECFQPILLNGNRVGAIYLRYDLSALYGRLKNYLGIAVLVFLVSILVALALSLWLQRFITGPALRLLETTRTVSLKQDYAIRAVKESEDELGQLVDGFNTMLEEIQRRDAQLSRHRDQLEEEVAARTAELQRTNRDLIRARDRAEKASRLKTALLTNMSHEFRTPIAAILGIVAILRDEVSEEHVEFIDMIEQSGQRLFDTLTAVLDLARLEAGDLTLEPALLDLNETVTTLVARHLPAAQQKGLTLITETSGAPLPGVIDLYGLETIVYHLVNNAVKFTETGTVRVEVTARGSQVFLTVQDTGIGIDPEGLPLLFEPFKQASMGLSRSYQGNGLGLAITQRMVALMEGEITVESRVGAGSRFTVTLPRNMRPFRPNTSHTALGKAAS